jgi:hypothetical protein
MTMLDPRAADMLAKLCGLFSSDHDGERASAAQKADQLIRSRVLTDWERQFLHGIRSWPNPLSEQQSRMLKA